MNWFSRYSFLSNIAWIAFVLGIELELILLLVSEWIFEFEFGGTDAGGAYELIFEEISTVYGCTLSLTGIVNCDESVRSYFIIL